MKDELGRKIMKEFTALRADKKAKGTKKCVIKGNLELKSLQATQLGNILFRNIIRKKRLIQKVFEKTIMNYY